MLNSNADFPFIISVEALNNRVFEEEDCEWLLEGVQELERGLHHTLDDIQCSIGSFSGKSA